MQGIKQTVENLSQQTRPQYRREHFSRKLHRIADLYPARVLEHLHVGSPPTHTQNFGFKAFISYTDVAQLVLHQRRILIDLDKHQAFLDPYYLRGS